MSTRREAQDARDQLKAAIDRAHKVQARCVEQMDDKALGKDAHLLAARNHKAASSMVNQLTPALREVEAHLEPKGAHEAL